MRTLVLGLLVGLTGVAMPASATETVRYVYDAKGRLVQVQRTGTVNNGVTATYRYDRANNRRRVTVSGSPNTTPP